MSAPPHVSPPSVVAETGEDELSPSREELLARVRELERTQERQRHAVAELARAEATLDHERSILASVLEATDVLLAYLDAGFRFVWVNAAYAANGRMRPEEFVGKSHFALYPHAENEAIFRRVRETGEAAFFKDKPFEYADQPERGVTYWDWSLVPVKGARGDVHGLVFSLRETTKRKLAELALRAADEQKSRFLSILSHELRNPLAPIRNATHVLALSDALDDRGRRATRVIERQVDHLARLVDDLLDLTRISHGKIQLQRTRVDVADLVRRAVEDHGSTLDGHEVSLAQPDAPVVVDADPVRLAQVVGNLLQNAAKFTPRGGRIAIGVRAADGGAVVDVTDDGVGIEPALLERLFDPFIQADRSLERRQGGLGLGLALVKGMIELHGGRVLADSAGPGQGARFTVRLPLGSGDLPRDTAPDLRVAPRRARRVLVIEDNKDAADSLAEVLLLTGKHEVSVAYSGPEGLAKARALRPEIVLCDIGLPEMDGYEVARTVRSEPALATAYLVALTGYAQPEDQRLARKAGFDAHLAKPPDLAVLERLLREAPGASPPDRR